MKDKPISVRCEHCERMYEVPFGLRAWVMEFAFCPQCKYPRYPEKYVAHWGQRVCSSCHVPLILTRSRYRDYCEACYLQIKGFPSQTNYLKVTVKSYTINNEYPSDETGRTGEPGGDGGFGAASGSDQDKGGSSAGQPINEVGIQDTRKESPISSENEHLS